MRIGVSVSIDIHRPFQSVDGGVAVMLHRNSSGGAFEQSDRFCATQSDLRRIVSCMMGLPMGLDGWRVDDCVLSPSIEAGSQPRRLHQQLRISQRLSRGAR